MLSPSPAAAPGPPSVLSRLADADRTFAVVDPSDGRVIAEAPDRTVDDALRALSTVSDAAGAWARTTPGERSRVLLAAADRLGRERDELAAWITAEMGKPLAEARAEVAYAADYLRWFAGEAVRIGGTAGRTATGVPHQTSRVPVGPCLLMTPWNFPLAMLARKLGPALAAGCTALVKPSESTPVTALMLADLLERAGLPEGVLEVVPTTQPVEVVSALLADPSLRKLSFTGSTEVGQQLLRQAAAAVLRSSMELGGNAPFVVLDDADLALAVSGAVEAKMRNAGQACTAANRFLVHQRQAEPFLAALTERFAALRVGPGRDPRSDVGPLASLQHRDRVAGLVRDAVARGARVAFEGSVPEGPGAFLAPTILTHVPADAAIATAEIFGPVVQLATFDDDDEAVERANATPYGLAAYVYGRDVDRVRAVAGAIEAGMVALNSGSVSAADTPFGGVKASGLGREGGREGIGEYLETKLLVGPIAP